MTAGPFIAALARAAADAGDQVFQTGVYTGDNDLLVLYGVGEASRNEARKAQLASGKHALLWDLGYFGFHGKRDGWLRCTIDHDHPQAFLDHTDPDPIRWEQHEIKLRDDCRRDGHILLIGLGRKSRSYLNEPDWEADALERIRAQYPGQRIVYRPKPGHPSPHLNVDTDDSTPIAKLLQGASLVVCRHSNVAVDAVIAGVPYECEDGAAIWLRGRPYTRENRLDFLRRLAWWQWRASEAARAWAFAKRMLAHA